MSLTPHAVDAHPASLRLADWFDDRVRPLVAYAPDAPGARWRAAGAVPPAPELEALLARAEAEGTVPRVALTWVAGWQGGAVAIAAAIGLLRDGILVRQGLEVLVHPDGWVADMRVRAGRGLAAPGHVPSATRGRAPRDDLPAAFADLLVEHCTPLVGALADRSGRGRAGLWAQVADAVGGAATVVAAAEPERPQDELLEETRRLLVAPGVPWRTRPGLRRVGDDGGVLVVHRGSCCLAYRCDPPEEPAEPDALRRAYLERFGDDPPRYCDTCLFREARDVDTRVAWFAARNAA